MNKQTVLAAAKKLHGKAVYLDVNRRAVTPERRAEIIAGRQAAKQREEELRDALRGFGGIQAVLERLNKAAQFVLDVDAATNAIDELAAANNRASDFLAIVKERQDLIEARRSQSHHVLCKKYTLFQRDKYLPIASLQIAAGDTFQELYDDLTREAVHVQEYVRES